MSMNPWNPSHEDGPPPPRRPGWGCLMAAIVTGLGVIVMLVLLVNLLGAAFDGIRIR